MRCERCGRCCRETMMELSEEDVQRLVCLGHAKDDFCLQGEDGILRLRNVGGRCHFLSTDGGSCTVYESRPLGCDIYPVNCDQEGRVFVDDFCQAMGSVTKGELKRKGVALRRHLRVIDAEAERRRTADDR